MRNSYDYEEFKLKIGRIYLSYVRLLLDLKDFIYNTPIAIRTAKEKRIKFETSRYERYSLEKIIDWDTKLIFEMSVIKIISEYENFLVKYFYEISKVDEKYKLPSDTKNNALNIKIFAEFLENTFGFNISEELKCWEELVESYYRRNIYTHNRGRINRTYLANVKNPPKKQGSLEIDLSYILSCIVNFVELFKYLFLRIVVSYFHCHDVDNILIKINDRRSYNLDLLALT